MFIHKTGQQFDAYTQDARQIGMFEEEQEQAAEHDTEKKFN